MRVYQHSIEMNEKLAGLARQLERNDRDLLRQLKRRDVAVPHQVGFIVQRGAHDRIAAGAGGVNHPAAPLDDRRPGD